MLTGRRMLRPSLVVFAALLLGVARPVRADGELKLGSVELEGKLLESKDRLLRFLDLVPGAVFDPDSLAERLERLDYRLLEANLEAGRLRLRVEPMRVLRLIAIHGNPPLTLFDDEIQRHLSLRSGAQLGLGNELPDFFRLETGRLQLFLEREGYFDGRVRLDPHPGPRREWIDLDVDLDLGKAYHLGRVRPTGNHAISRPELFDVFDHCCFWWGRYRQQRVRDDAREAERVLRDRGYPSARVEPDTPGERDLDRKSHKVTLSMRVSEKRRVEIRFQGNRELSERDLRDQLTIFSSGAYDQIELEESARTIHRAYQQHGFFESQVQFERRRRGTDLEEVEFIIHEGPELKVRLVDFTSLTTGSLTFSDEELAGKAAIETKVFPALGIIGLGEGGYVTDVQLAQDKRRLIDFYHAQGFPQVQVRAEVVREPNAFDFVGVLGADVAAGRGHEDDLYVRFYIEEGRRELIDHIEVLFDGPHIKTEMQVYKVLKMTTGTGFVESVLRDEKESIQNLYRSLAHPYVQILPDPQWNPAHDRVTLRYRIDEGPMVRFGEILIRGNFKTHERVIRADLPFHAGDPFDLTKLEAGTRNLRTHLIFNNVKVDYSALDERRNPVPVLVRVEERYLDWGGLMAGAGVATDRLPYYGYLVLSYFWGNFFGFGSQLELRGDFGFSTDSFGFNARYTDLRAFGPGWRLDANAFYRREITFRLGTIATLGASIGLTRFLTENLRVFVRYDNYLSQLGVPFYRLIGPADRSTVPDNTHTAKLVTGVVWDRRVGVDNLYNPLMPVKGWLLSASTAAAIRAPTVFFGDHDFLVFSGQALGLLPLRFRHREFTLIANLRYDHGVPLGEPALPVVERFFAGGDTTTRGYDPDQLKTEIVFGDVGPLGHRSGFRVLPQGGNIRMLSTLELQFPIAPTLAWPWVGAIFYDVGAIVNAPNLIHASDFKHAIGLTLLRFLTPFGPLSLEYAYPITQSVAEERWKVAPWYAHWPGRIHINWGLPLGR